MKYQELWNDENTRIMERYDLSMERIGQFVQEEAVQQPYRDYFVRMSRFAGQIEELARRQMRDELEDLPLEELQQLNRALFEDILPEHYETSYANPNVGSKEAGRGAGGAALQLYAQFREAVVFAYDAG